MGGRRLRVHLQELNAQERTSPAASGSETANALNAYDFMVQALGHLKDGDYAGYLCSMDLAGQFARDARNDYYRRAAAKPAPVALNGPSDLYALNGPLGQRKAY